MILLAELVHVRLKFFGLPTYRRRMDGYLWGEGGNREGIQGMGKEMEVRFITYLHKSHGARRILYILIHIGTYIARSLVRN